MLVLSELVFRIQVTIIAALQRSDRLVCLLKLRPQPSQSQDVVKHADGEDDALPNRAETELSRQYGWSTVTMQGWDFKVASRKIRRPS